MAERLKQTARNEKRNVTRFETEQARDFLSFQPCR